MCIYTQMECMYRILYVHDFNGELSEDCGGTALARPLD